MGMQALPITTTEEVMTMDEQQHELIRTLFWIAFVWNDHNFENHPEQTARDVCERYGIQTLADANEYLESISE